MHKYDVLFAIEDAGFVKEYDVTDESFYFKKSDILLSYTVPHDGNGDRHMIRAEHVDEFDKWGNASVEEFVNNVPDMIDLLNTIESRFGDAPYSEEDYEDARSRGLDLNDYNDWLAYNKMEDHAENDVTGDQRYARD